MVDYWDVVGFVGGAAAVLMVMVFVVEESGPNVAVASAPK